MGTGRAPGTWPSANSQGSRTSMTSASPCARTSFSWWTVMLRMPSTLSRCRDEDVRRDLGRDLGGLAAGPDEQPTGRRRDRDRLPRPYAGPAQPGHECGVPLQRLGEPADDHGGARVDADLVQRDQPRDTVDRVHAAVVLAELLETGDRVAVG